MPIDLAASFDPPSSKTMISMGGNSSSETVRTPVGHLADLKQVQVGTTAVILVAFLYLLHAAYRTASRISSCNQHAKVE
jgi:PIG-X / PBN1